MRMKFLPVIDLGESAWRFVKDCMHAGILFFRNTGLLGKSGNFVVVHMPSVGFMYSKAVKKTG